jgi:hypothetical protein
MNKDIEHVPVHPLKHWPIHYGPIPTSNCVVVDKGEVGNIKLVLYDPRVMSVPVVVDPAVGQALVDICKEPGRLQVFGRVFPPPDPDKAVGLTSRIAQDPKAVSNRGILAICRYDSDLSGGIIFQTMKRTLNMASDYLALAELHAPVNTLVPKAADFPMTVPPEDEFLSQSDHPDGFASNLGGVHNYVPLLGNHM